MEYSMDNIADLLGSLKESDLDALRETAQSLFGQTSPAQDVPPQTEPSGISPEMLARLGRVMHAMQQGDTGRSALIAALKPYLSAPRQRRADEAMQMLRLLDVLPMLESGLF